MKSSLHEEEALKDILEALGKKLRDLRKEMGYASHADFAADHGLPSVQYWRIEKGRANITLKSLHRVCTIHGLTLGQLFAMVFESPKSSSRGLRKK